MLRLLYRFHGRPVYEVGRPIPLVGHISFGIIDRGTNVVQVRPSTVCPHSCIFCSVDAGPRPWYRSSEYMVDPGWLAAWLREVVRVKGGGVEVLLDGMGEPLTHPRITEIIRRAKETRGVERVAVETHGGFLSKSLARELERSGLDRINLSIDAVSPKLASRLVGAAWYDPSRILRIAEWIVENTGIDVVLTPVVVPGLNEGEIIGLIEWAKRVRAGAKSGWPTGVLIQKYESHRWGRKIPGIRPWSWDRFYKWLAGLEARTGYKLLVEPEDLGFKKKPSLEKPYRAGEKVKLVILGDGLRKGELLAMDIKATRSFTYLSKEPLSPGKIVVARIVRDKDNIYLAR